MLTEKVINTIEKYKMLEGGEKVTSALSGGADSVCLLLILKSLEKKYSLTVDAVHINHCIRGEEADRDEQFCIDLCRKLDIPLTVKKINVPEIAAPKKQSLEETARNARYEYFAVHTVNGKLASAHTASDNAETLILNLARGTGLKGLCGIPPVRDNIIRPLIDINRQDVENFLKECGQEFVTDSTNYDIMFTRNRIRHKIIPEILRINNGFFKTFCAELKIFSEENFFIEKSAKNAYNICNDNGALSGLEKFDPVIRKRCIAIFFKEKALPVSFEKIIAVDKILERGGKINIAGNTWAVCRKNVLTVVRLPDYKGEITLREGENSIFSDKILMAEIKNNAYGIIDINKVQGNITVRGRNYGDKIQLAGKNFESSVKKLLNEKIRADLRPYIHFLADDKGLIFIEGIGIADRVRPDEYTEKSLYITVEDVKDVR